MGRRMNNPLMICGVGMEIGAFIGQELVQHEKYGDKKLFKISYKPAWGCSDSAVAPWGKPVYLPYNIPEDAIKVIHMGDNNRSGTARSYMLILYDAEGHSMFNVLTDQHYLDVIKGKDKKINELSTQITKYHLKAQESQEEAKKVIKDAKDLQRTMDPEKKNNPFMPWRRDGGGFNNGGGEQ
jgi:hypothetical protein